jgi:hypothetical protein
MADAPAVQFEGAAQGIPSAYSILITNATDQDPPQEWISLPEAGTLWVGYEFQGAPATVVEIWHQGGNTETIQPGLNNQFTVGQGDAIVIQLAAPDQSIKLGWGYV